MPSSFRPRRASVVCLLAILSTGLWAQTVLPASSLAATVSLLHPCGLAYDTQGNLFFAEAGNHSIRRLDPQGNLTTVVGTGSQGFSGDAGPATQAKLDSPHAVTLDSAGDLFVADTHNQRIRRVDSVTQIITTVAGTGVAGFSGDAAQATSARLASPLALALASDSLLYIADSANHRIRRIDLPSGKIITIAGTGTQGFAGDGGSALSANLNTPAGIVIDASGNLYIADTGNHRVRRVDASTQIISTVAGGTPSSVLLRPENLALLSSTLLIADAASQRALQLDLKSGILSTFAGTGTQAFQGDGGPASAAMLDSPSALALSPTGAVAIADTGNQRVRQIAADGSISTLVGLGALIPGSLSLTGATTQSYGTTTLVAALLTGNASNGSVSLLDVTTGNTTLLKQTTLSAGIARFNLPSLSAGTHRLLATFSGSTTQRAAQSQIFSISISPLPLTATLVGSLTSVYGQPLPQLSATLSGLLSTDSARVTVGVATTALQTSSPGIYPITLALQGTAAANYTLVASSAALTIAKAPVSTTLTQANGALTAQVATSSLGVPTGTVTLLTAAGTRLSTLILNADGSARISAANLADGSYTVTAIYSGDVDFLSAQSPAINFVVGIPSVPPDFSFSMAGSAAQTVDSGATAQFTVGLASSGSGSLAGPITLSASALPVGFTANFDPPVIPPGGTVPSFTLSVVTPRTQAAAARPAPRHDLIAIAWICPILLLGILRGRRRLLIGSLAALTLCGCGARINSTASGQVAAITYPIVITGTTTNLDGSVLQHSITATLTVQ